MDYSINERFAKTFIRRSKRDRMLFELTTPSKVYGGVDRFCHEAEELLDPAKIIMQGEDLDRSPAFGDFVRKHKGSCYVLTPSIGPDDQFMPLDEAVREAVISCDAAIIIGDDFAIVFGESEKGGRGKYLLSASGKTE